MSSSSYSWSARSSWRILICQVICSPLLMATTQESATAGAQSLPAAMTPWKATSFSSESVMVGSMMKEKRLRRAAAASVDFQLGELLEGLHPIVGLGLLVAGELGGPDDPLVDGLLGAALFPAAGGGRALPLHEIEQSHGYLAPDRLGRAEASAQRLSQAAVYHKGWTRPNRSG